MCKITIVPVDVYESETSSRILRKEQIECFFLEQGA
jgi:hypothetical protein